MSENDSVGHRVCGLLPAHVEGFDSLAELALDMRWSWNHAADEVWWQLDPALWELTHNPWGILQTVSRDQIARAMADPAFRSSVERLLQGKRDWSEAPAFEDMLPDEWMPRAFFAYWCPDVAP